MSKHGFLRYKENVKLNHFQNFMFMADGSHYGRCYGHIVVLTSVAGVIATIVLAGVV